MTPRLPRHGDARGFTLTEVMIVVVLSGVVTLGLVAFYLNSQAMWMDASTQALAQRDATALVEYMRSKVQAAAKAVVLSSSPDDLNHLVILYDGSLDELDRFWWEATDSLVHHGTGPSGADQGAVFPTTVERFHLSLDGTLPLLTVDTLRVRSTTGQKVQMSTTISLYNSQP